MAPSKDWMDLVDDDRLDPKCKEGVDQFLDYAYEKLLDSFNENDEDFEIRCPCIKCNNVKSGNRESVRTHLIVHGIIKNYRFWCHHGERQGESISEFDEEQEEMTEESQSDDEMQEMIGDLFHNSTGVVAPNATSSQDILEQEPDGHAKQFYSLLGDSKKPLYEGSKCSKLSALVKLLHIKSLNRWSNKSFSMLLQFLNEELLPGESTLPNSYDEAKKLIRDLGLSYEKIDSCPFSCMLFWKNEEGLDTCQRCGASRWKLDKHGKEIKRKANGKKIPQKTLRYFPLKPRLQRLYMSSKTASDMRWHHERQVEDGVMRHPADSKAWKNFNELHESFAEEPRNVRLGLASDGFQPFTNSKVSYSIWPVLLVPYNLPPWMCMKQSNFILSMLIPGPTGPGDAIDTYLQPLIEELKELWASGVRTYDVSLRQNFILRAALIWTINDFPAYANLSGWSTKGKLACPCCNKHTHSIRLKYGGKQSYMGHRRYLDENHSWRKDKKSFDGTRERGYAAPKLTGDDILKQNICDSLLGTIMNIKGKTKDNIKARLDLQLSGLKPELHPIQRGDKLVMPAACYTLSQEEQSKFCRFLKELKVPDGFSSNISQCVNLKERKILGLKSHDCHILSQRLIPVSIRGLLPAKVCEPIIELSIFFTILCAKTLRVDELKQIDEQIPLTLCKLEKIFPPSIFDVMLHLVVHLASEAILGGPVRFRWMYLVERQLYTYKSYIRNRVCPEGSIAKGYIADECMTLCSRYLKGFETKFNRLERNYEDDNRECHEAHLSIFRHSGRALGAATTRYLDEREWLQAHIYVLKNCDEVQPHIEDYNEFVREPTNHYDDKDWDKNFIEWFQSLVYQSYREDDDLLSLSLGPIVGDAGNGGDIDYYGALVEVVELEYLGGRNVVLFRCKWWDVHGKGKETALKEDKYGFISINCRHLLKTNDHFILAGQASQVFYVEDIANEGWHVVLKAQPRDSYDMPPDTDDYEITDDGVEAYLQDESFDAQAITYTSLVDDDINLRRGDIDPIITYDVSFLPILNLASTLQQENENSRSHFQKQKGTISIGSDFKQLQKIH
ncbi:uncharacterized protein LOC109826563 [Asparagus officinalis]|uniref:uncharacterized protein LOC109826563 n=1 Tax=Asparagus officinalis TaxID=4686 RepID=UPI00098DF824|nr:uncharacterized protein LOC109826563 [Asparagus officinalis]